jgi:hypothetical protein
VKTARARERVKELSKSAEKPINKRSGLNNLFLDKNR